MFASSHHIGEIRFCDSLVLRSFEDEWHHDLLIFSGCVSPFGMLGYRFLSPLHGLIQLDFRVLRKGQHVLQIVQVGGTSKRSQ